MNKLVTHSLETIIALGLVGQIGCATIVKGRTQLVSIDSNVRGAQVLVNGMTVGTTPFNGPIERGASSQVTIRKDGYFPKTITLSTEFEPIFWGNFIIGGVLGSSTDSGTGAMYKYSPTTFQLDLSPNEEGKAPVVPSKQTQQN